MTEMTTTQDDFRMVVDIIKTVTEQTGETPEEFTARALATAKTEMLDAVMRATFGQKENQ